VFSFRCFTNLVQFFKSMFCYLLILMSIWIPYDTEPKDSHWVLGDSWKSISLNFNLFNDLIGWMRRITTWVPTRSASCFNRESFYFFFLFSIFEKYASALLPVLLTSISLNMNIVRRLWPLIVPLILALWKYLTHSNKHFG
jgi:hypothetical protein